MEDMETLCWPRAEHLQRTFQVRSGDKTGTAFTLEQDDRQYLVSALHVVERAVETASLDIWYQNAWHTMAVVVVGMSMEQDIVVLAAPRLLGHVMNIEIDYKGCVAGQEVFILGYPLGIRGPSVDPGFPLPIIKRGIVAYFQFGDPGALYISASANPGFSGGPVFFPSRERRRALLAAILISELAYEVPVRDETAGKQIGVVEVGSNIVRCTWIGEVLKIIQGNPRGLPLH